MTRRLSCATSHVSMAVMAAVAVLACACGEDVQDLGENADTALSEPGSDDHQGRGSGENGDRDGDGNGGNPNDPNGPNQPGGGTANTGASEDDILGTAPPCTGVKVPGDYATVQSAVDSGAASICVGAGTFKERVHVDRARDVKIFGAGANLTKLQSLHANGGGLELGYLTVTESAALATSDYRPNVPAPTKRVRFHHARFLGARNDIIGSRGQYRTPVYSSGSALTILRHDSPDGVDFEAASCVFQSSPTPQDPSQNYTGTNGIAIHVHATCDRTPPAPCARVNVVIKGSLVRDSNIGVLASYGHLGDSALEVSGNRIEHIGGTPAADEGTALQITLSESRKTTSATYKDNLITTSKLGLAVWQLQEDEAILTHSGNKLSDNQTNYAGIAQPD